ncbi:hypothetical protein F4604DRAFT_1919416 [Suillus subluteus]|nr:hypothetical protein F4604DRAFT_1919416 [Suillus subluteus]
MPALVASPDTSSYHSFLPSQYRYETSGSSINTHKMPSLSGSKSKPNLKKQMPPSLVPARTISKELMLKKPFPTEEVVEETKPAEVTLPIATDSWNSPFTANLLPTVRVREVWKYLTELAPEKSRREFHGVGAKEFELIECVAEETGRLVSKPKLTYDYNELVLIVDMPSDLHEELFDYFKDCLALAIAGIPYNRQIIRPQISMNYRLKVGDKTVTPDLTVTISATSGPTERVVISGLGECALSENKFHVFAKMQDEIMAHPEVDFAIIILINEATPYKSPIPDSTTSKALISENDTDINPLPLGAFIRQCSTPCQFNNPVKVADHNWCQVESVEYFIWTKGVNGAPINIDDHDPQWMAYGTLVPTTNMGSIMTMLERGLSRMKQSMVRLTQEIVSNADCTLLGTAIIMLPIEWSLAASGILSAMDTTAHQCYEDWFIGQIQSYRNQRRHALVYSPPRASKQVSCSLPLTGPDAEAEAEAEAQALANVGRQTVLPWATIE